MELKCPKHHVPLDVKNMVLFTSGVQLPTVVGVCPFCRTKYINRRIFNCNSVVIDKIRYEFSETMHDSFPFDEEKEHQRIKENLRLIEATAHQEKRNKAKQEAREKKLEKQRIQQEHSKELEAERLKKIYQENPKQVYHPAFITKCKSIPDRCPFDGDELFYVPVHRKRFKDKRGWCCFRCSRLFVSEPDHKSNTTTKENKDKNKDVSKVAKLIVDKEKKICFEHQPIKKVDIEKLIHTQKEPYKDLPPSTILVANLLGNGQRIGYVIIVANACEQDAEKGIYWVGRAIPSIILFAIRIQKKGCFSYKGKDYKVINYQKVNEAEKYFNVISRFCNPSNPQTVYVFSHKNLPHFQQNNYEVVTAMVPCGNLDFPVPISVYYEKSTMRYFINEELYTLAREKYGLPYMRLCAESQNPGSSGFSELRKNSYLNLLGYSVNANDGLTSEDRHRLLSKIIDCRLLSKSEIMNHLEWLIRTRGNMPHMENAVFEWRADLRFVSEYDMIKQRSIWVDRFKTQFFSY